MLRLSKAVLVGALWAGLSQAHAMGMESHRQGIAVGEPIPGFKLLMPVSLLHGNTIYYRSQAFQQFRQLVPSTAIWIIHSIIPAKEGPLGDWYYLILQAKNSSSQIAVRTQRKLALNLAAGDELHAIIHAADWPIISIQRMNNDVVATLADTETMGLP